MTAVPKPRKLSEAEYLAIERAAAFKSEFYDGQMFAMAGASPSHNRVKDNLAFRLNAALVGGPCFAVTSDQRVRVNSNRLYTYPDIVVVCDPAEYAADDPDTLLNPKVLVEVLSDSTRRYDRGPKFRLYQQIPSLQEYILAEQDEAVVERFVRQADGSWALTAAVGLDAELVLASVPARVRLADIYAGVPLTETPGRS